MSAETHDLLIVGGGPAGLAAAAEAAATGLGVVLVDERPTFGGQIFKAPGPGFRIARPEAVGREYVAGLRLLQAAERAGARLLPRTSAIAIRGTTVVLVEDGRPAR
ncbi:MAG: FAD-dependent oxidoreductase, partial [Actinobacteria bacterium]|nr:FAD-dependent oxidoreductase [Actinomycetota bacterium]